jgi:hypothetical protein
MKLFITLLAMTMQLTALDWGKWYTKDGVTVMPLKFSRPPAGLIPAHVDLSSFQEGVWIVVNTENSKVTEFSVIVRAKLESGETALATGRCTRVQPALPETSTACILTIGRTAAVTDISVTQIQAPLVTNFSE